MGTKEKPGEFDCYHRAEDDEPMFVLLARDPLAPELVRLWAKARAMATRDVRDARKAEEASHCAAQMERWKEDHPDHGHPG